MSILGPFWAPRAPARWLKPVLDQLSSWASDTTPMAMPGAKVSGWHLNSPRNMGHSTASFISYDVHACINVYMHLYIYVYIYIYVVLYIYMCVLYYIYIYVILYICVIYIYMYTCVCVCVINMYITQVNKSSLVIVGGWLPIRKKKASLGKVNHTTSSKKGIDTSGPPELRCYLSS